MPLTPPHSQHPFPADCAALPPPPPPCRVLAQYCRSTSAFSTLVKWHPELLAKATPRRLAALLHNLGELLPEGFDPTEVRGRAC